MTPADIATSAARASGSARSVSQSRGRVGLASRRYPQHVGELSGGHLDTHPGQEADQHGAGKEIRQEPQPGDPGQQQHPPGQQRRQPRQPDVLRRPGHRQPGQRGGQDRGGGRVRRHHQVTRRAQDREHRHRQEQRVQAGNHRHPSDLRVPQNLRDAQGGQRDTGQQIRGHPGSLDRQHAPQHRKRPQPSPPAAPWGTWHCLTPRPLSTSGLRFVHHPAVPRSARSRPGAGRGPPRPCPSYGTSRESQPAPAAGSARLGWPGRPVMLRRRCRAIWRSRWH